MSAAHFFRPLAWFSLRWPAAAILGLLLAGFVAAFFSAAEAQESDEPAHEVRLGSRIPWRIERPTATQREGTRVLYNFARCIVGEKPQDSLALLRTSVTAPEHSAIVSRLSGKNNRCLRGAQRMSLSVAPFRGAIANALYLRDYPAFPADRLPAQPDRAGEMLSGDPEAILSGFARCVVRTDPAGVDSLLRTRAGSDEEHRLLVEMGGHFSSCLFRGQGLEANALTLRSILAEAAYTLSDGATNSAATR